MSLSQADPRAVLPYNKIAAATSYGRSLRVIGQDLAHLFPKVLEVRTDGVNFEVRGESHPNPFEAIKESVFKKTWKKLLGKESVTGPAQTKPPVASFARNYSCADIEGLDQLHSADRTGIAGRADVYSLAERLRTMGAIVDSKNGRLRLLLKEADRLFVEYWDQQGTLQSAKLTTIIMYRNRRQFDQQRRSASCELWEGYDF